MPHLEGQSLGRILRGQPLPPGTVVAWGLQVARALAAVHERGELYLALNPSNIIIQPTGAAGLLESGLSSLPGRVDRAAAWMGAAPYMSPEQAHGEAVDERSDVFSLGVLLYQMATGKRPFAGATREETLAEIVRGQLVPARALAPLPRALDDIISKALAHDPSSRFQKMAEVIDGLLALDAGEVTPSPPRGSSALAKRRTFLLALGGVGFVLVGAFALWQWLRGPDRTTLLVFPMEVRGQSEGADYLGRSFAEALASNLAQAQLLRVLPVPQSSEVEGVGALGQARTARRFGAGRLISGALTRKGETIEATLRLVDSSEENILWGTSSEAPDSDLSALASALARRMATELGVAFPRLYDHIGNLTGGPAMAATPYTSQALGALQRGDVRELLAASAALVAAFPEEPDANALRTHALVLAWDANRSPVNREALEASLKELERTDPNNPYGPVYRAYLLHLEGRSDEAMERFSQILERQDLAPAVRSWVLRYRSMAKAVTVDKTAALADLEEALRLDPTSARTFDILSNNLLDLGQNEQALGRAHQAVALMPSYWRNHQTLGMALSALGRASEAKDAFVKACELGSAQPACALYAIALWRTGLKEEARAEALRSATLTEDSAGAYNLACFWALAGERREALRLLRRALELGFPGDRLASDPDLLSLRHDPDFQALLPPQPVPR